MTGRILAFLYGAVAYAGFFATFLYAIGFVGNFVVPKSMDSPAEGPWQTALLIDAALLALFARQQTGDGRQALGQRQHGSRHGQPESPAPAPENAGQAEHSDEEDDRCGDEVGQVRGLFLALVVQVFDECGHKCRRQRTFGEEIPRQVGNTEADNERVELRPGSEQPGHHTLADKAGHPAHQHRYGCDAGAFENLL